MEYNNKHIVSNLTAFYLSFQHAPDADFSETDDLFLFRIKGKSWLNFALNKQASEKNIDLLINDIKSFNAGNSPPIHWIIQEKDAKRFVKPLQTAGYTPIKVWTNMQLQVNSSINVPEIPNLTIRKITSSPELQDWITVQRETDKNSQFRFEDFKPILNDKRFAFYLGFYNNIPVATSLILQHEQVAGLYLIAVKNEYRKRGIGQAVTLLPMAAAQKNGINNFVLHSTKAGENMYQKIGFEDYGKMYIFAQKLNS